MAVQLLIRKPLRFGAVTLTLLNIIVCTAQDVPVQVAPAAEPAATNSNAGNVEFGSSAQKLPEQRRLGRGPISPAVSEILRMLDAGVSKEVVKAYLEGASVTSKPTPSDMILLKERGVPDDVTVALLKRSAQIPAVSPTQPSQGLSSGVSQVAPAANNGNSPYLDPESYQYFQYYYLYPRSLAYAYDRLGLYPWSYYPGYNGWHRPFFPRQHVYGPYP